MTRPITRLVLLTSSVALLAGGCGFLEALNIGTTTVQLRNNGTFDVDVTIHVSSDSNASSDELEQQGEQIVYTIQPGETIPFVKSCPELQSIVVSNATLKTGNSFEPQTQSGVLRAGADFNCGDTIVFTFTHSGLLVDFSVSSSVN